MPTKQEQIAALVSTITSEELAQLEAMSDRLNDLGNMINVLFEGTSGLLFWESAMQLEQIADQLKYIKETGEYSAFPDEAREASSK